jgi:hypothetical protein
MGISLFDGYRLVGVQQDNRERLKALVLADTTGNDVPPSAPGARGRLEPYGTEDASGLPTRLLSCRILLTADAHNVDPDVFHAVHSNGLVYDRRLIVGAGFETTDPHIFAAGPLCEFSRRFRSEASYLRHDGFNGREVGAQLARAMLPWLDPGQNTAGAIANASASEVSASSKSKSRFVKHCESARLYTPASALPSFFLPLAKSGLLPGPLHYYHMEACEGLRLEGQTVEIVTDTMNNPLPGTPGHFCRLKVDAHGQIASITYLGSEELQVEALWKLVGLSEALLNHLHARWQSGDIPDLIEFLADDWASALWHDRFLDFIAELKSDLSQKEDFMKQVKKVSDGDGTREELISKFNPEYKQEMQDKVLRYLRANTNHLHTYFLPEHWDAEVKEGLTSK